MAEKAINLNHTTGTITTTNDEVVSIGVNGALKIGDGSSLDLYKEDRVTVKEEGYLAVSQKKPNSFEDEDGVYRLYQSNKDGEWEVLAEPYNDTMDIIYAIIMGR